jgi:hypothetical protein
MATKNINFAHPGRSATLPRTVHQRRTSQRASNTGKPLAGMFPTDIQTQPIQKLVLRYIANPGGDDVIVTVQNLLGAQIAVASATTSTRGVSLQAAFRITMVKYWGINDSSNANVNETISLTWLGQGGLGLSRAITSTGSDAVPAHISSRPPEDSECGWWHNYDAVQSNGLFYVTNPPQGAILDIHIDYITTGQSATSAPATPLASTSQIWTIPASNTGIYRQQLTAGGTLGGTTVFNPVGLAILRQLRNRLCEYTSQC